MKAWITRLEELEKKSAFLNAEEQLEQWIKDQGYTPPFPYFEIMAKLPHHLKATCLDKVLNEMRKPRGDH